MKSDQSAKRPVPAGVMRMNKRWPDLFYKFPHPPDLAEIVQLEGQILAQAMDVNSFEYSLALTIREDMDLVTLSLEVIRPPNGMGNGQIGKQADSPRSHRCR
jgi:hypothetical protein